LENRTYQALVDDKSLQHWITSGVPGTQMPAFGESAGGLLTQQQVDALVVGMRQHWATSIGLVTHDMPSYLPVSVGDVDRGEQVYRTRCLSCHQGDKQKITDPAYLALMSDQSLRTIVIAGRPDLGHPDWKQASADKRLSEQDVSDIVMYLHSLRSDTPGQPYPDKSVKR
jgi:mono/diheme cytochrome c family protein